MQSRLPDLAEDELPVELVELGQRIQKQPSEIRAELDHSFDRVVDSIRRRRRILSLVQEALSQLRLDIKYLMFDLEMTKRERDALQAELDGREPL